MQFQVLGPLGVRVGTRVSTPTGRLQRTLLSVLLAHPGRPVAADRLTEVLWPGLADERVDAKLHVLVHRLRSCLDSPDRLTHGPGGYTLTVEDDELDSIQFEQLSSSVLTRGKPPATVVDAARAALDLWHGGPFEGQDLPVLSAVAGRWNERRVSVAEHLFAAELACGHHDAVIDELAALAAEHPLRERFQELLMTALHRSGRQSEALAVYRRCREALVDELGIEPGQGLQDLHAQVLAGEPVGSPGVAAVPVAAQLPPTVPEFQARGPESSELDKLAASVGDAAGTSPVCVVTGMPGVGKTAFVVHWAHQHRTDFPDGQLFYDLRGFSADPQGQPGDVLDHFIRALGANPGELPRTVDARAAALRSLLDGRRVLIVLDNARSVEQLRPLLPSAPGCLVVVTSRESLSGLVAAEGARSIRVDRLSDGDSLDLLAKLLGDAVHRERESYAELVARCGNLPLALRIAAEQIRVRPGEDVASIVDELTDERSRLDLLDSGDGPRTDVRAVLSWSYDLLCPESARLVRVLGLLPGRDADAWSVAALAGRDLWDARRLLRTLARKHLVDVLPGPRYAQHDLLRDYAAELSAGTDPVHERAKARTRLLAHYASTAAAAMRWIEPPNPSAAEPEPERAAGYLTDLDAAVTWLRLERTNILAALEDAGPADGGHVIDLGRSLSNHLLDSGYARDALRLREAARGQARAVGDLDVEAQAESAIGTLYGHGGDLDGAEAHVGRALELYRASGCRAGEAVALNNLGVVAGMRGRPQESIRLYLRAVETNRAIGSPHEAAIEVCNVASSYLKLEDHDRAHEYFTQTVELARAINNHKPLGLALCGLGRIHERRDDFTVALDLAQEALAIGRSTGYLVIEGYALEVIGTVQRRQGRLAQARRSLEDALAAGRRAELIIEALAGLARLHLAGDAHAALAPLGEALRLALERGLKGGEMETRVVLADAHEALSDPAAARVQLVRALSYYTECEAPRAETIRARLSSLVPQAAGN